MIYWHWLAGLSLLFAVLERLRPARREQAPLRPQLANDLVFLAFNGHVYALLTGGITGAVVLWTQRALGPWLPFASEGTGIARWHPAAQFAVFLATADFLQWCVHVLLHKVPLLWQFHKLHHSIHRMDWAGNFRFHWMELVVYKSALYVPLALLGGDATPLFWATVFATAWGHFNHANVDVDLGPLGYVFNSPRMHLWHHDASSEGGLSKNYGVVLSVWDWLFRTAYWPRDRAPERIGYAGDEEIPRWLGGQVLFPLTRRARREG